MISQWTCTRKKGAASSELALQFDGDAAFAEKKLLILPAIFDEANKMRRQTMLLMRELNAAGLASALPDLPGMNESLQPLSSQSLTQWRADAVLAAEQLGATHVLAIRGGALIAPTSLPGWHYAPASGARLLRNMLRSRILASKEAGREESTAQLGEMGRKDGIELAGWQFGAKMFGELQDAEPETSDQHSIIAQSDLGGAGLWLRAEAGDDMAQVKALAALITNTLMPT
ncbi:MAG: hypothetical protein ABJ242_09145 [Marinomonas sp.]